MNDESLSATECASPPCYLREVDPLYSGLPPPSAHAPFAPPPSDLIPWRKAQRERLIAQRLSLSAMTRAEHAQRMSEQLDTLIGDAPRRIVSAYWPFRGEPDLRNWLKDLQDRGMRTALPVVVAKGAPMVFRLWREGDRLARGVWNIPVPAEGEDVKPDIVIAPVVGFDSHCYRLGYGGGFFDRTLATLPPSTIAIGVGYAQAAIATIRPQGFDIPMHHIVTEHSTQSR
jgi:5,10-methenyltetrahydrofolate synthetase